MQTRDDILESYSLNGTRCGLAARQRDWAMANQVQRWHRYTLSREAPEFRDQCQRAFDDGYRAAAQPQPSTFA
jgi:hypothetical protein